MMKLSGRQIREGRLLTGLTPAALAAAANVNVEVVIRAELVDGVAQITKRDTISIQLALEAAGIEFDPQSTGNVGVKMRKSMGDLQAAGANAT